MEAAGPHGYRLRRSGGAELGQELWVQGSVGGDSAPRWGAVVIVDGDGLQGGLHLVLCCATLVPVVSIDTETHHAGPAASTLNTSAGELTRLGTRCSVRHCAKWGFWGRPGYRYDGANTFVSLVSLAHKEGPGAHNLSCFGGVITHFIIATVKQPRHAQSRSQRT